MAARRKTPETLDDLLADTLPTDTRYDEWAAEHGIGDRTLRRLRRGLHTPRLGTLKLLADALGVDVARVRKACEASRG